MYTGRNQSADDVIISLIKQHKDQKSILVTFDRQLCFRGANFGISCIDPDIFYMRMMQLWRNESISKIKKVEAVQTQIVKLSNSSDTLLDTLMFESCLQIMYKKEDTVENNLNAIKNKKNKKSKRERKLIHVLKKI